MEIDESIIKQTKHCAHDFECLENVNYLCRIAKVESCIDNSVLFIECPKNWCEYKLNFGYSAICNCPVRKEIYNKYKL